LLFFSVPKVATRFFAFESLSASLKGPDGKLSTSSTLLAGLGAGVAEAIVAGMWMWLVLQCIQGIPHHGCFCCALQSHLWIPLKPSWCTTSSRALQRHASTTGSFMVSRLSWQKKVLEVYIKA
jgi:hypothetical protein